MLVNNQISLSFIGQGFMIDLDLHRINFISVFVALDISKLDADINSSFLIDVDVRGRIFKLKVI